MASIDYSKIDDGLPITISTINGKSYKAEHVIVTVSLGVLKAKHMSLFTPTLPNYKINAIEVINSEFIPYLIKP